MIKRFSTAQGAKLDKLAQSVKQFSADVAARIKANGVKDVYFREVYIGYLADVAAATEKKQEGETKEEHARRLFVAAASKFEAMTDEEKAATYIYKEMAAALLNGLSPEEGAEEIKLRSRQYAKRQLTWFRRDSTIHWFLWGKLPVFESALAFSTQILKDAGL